MGPSRSSQAETCARYLAATGDAVPYGKDDNDNGNRDDSIMYPNVLLETLKKTPSGSGPWCLRNFAADEATSKTYVTGSPAQQAQTWTLKPTLITVTLGRQNSGIVESITTCLDNIKHHNFIEANVCALAVYANSGAFTDLSKELSGILGKYQTLMSGNPKLVVAVTGYYNPYPHATSVATTVPTFCAELVDTIPTCIARWILLPPALVTLDQVVKKLNTTISAVVAKLAQGNQNRFVFVNPYDQFNDHCMKMKVKIRTQVYHPPSTTDKHDAGETNFGCSDTYIGTDGKDVTAGFEPFTYLPPAIDGVLILADHDTKDLGVNPNKAGHECLAKLIWFNTYQKLGYPLNPVPPSTC